MQSWDIHCDSQDTPANFLVCFYFCLLTDLLLAFGRWRWGPWSPASPALYKQRCATYSVVAYPLAGPPPPYLHRGERIVQFAFFLQRLLSQVFSLNSPKPRSQCQDLTFCVRDKERERFWLTRQHSQPSTAFLFSPKKEGVDQVCLAHGSPVKSPVNALNLFNLFFFFFSLQLALIATNMWKHPSLSCTLGWKYWNTGRRREHPDRRHAVRSGISRRTRRFPSPLILPALQRYHWHSLTSTTKDILQSKPACYIRGPCESTALSFQCSSIASLALWMHGKDLFGRRVKVHEYLL